jgi:hypothetical protein
MIVIIFSWTGTPVCYGDEEMDIVYKPAAHSICYHGTEKYKRETGQYV